MADTFSCDPDAAARLAGDLGSIRSDLQAMGQTFTAYGGATGSGQIEDTLGQFYTDSSDSRDAMDKLLDRATGLMPGLAQGTTSVDGALATSLDPPSQTSAAQPAASGARR